LTIEVQMIDLVVIASDRWERGNPAKPLRGAQAPWQSQSL
jgi:hypothetical protein